MTVIFVSGFCFTLIAAVILFIFGNIGYGIMFSAICLLCLLALISYAFRDTIKEWLRNNRK